MKSRYFFVLLFAFFVGNSLPVKAQITEVQIGINGLTCSQCSRSVELHIRKLEFVKDVKMDLEHTQATIDFNADKKVDIDRIAQAVTDAGFSVRQLTATLQLTNVAVPANECITLNGENYRFIQTNKSKLNGPTTVQFLGEKYLPKKGFKKWEPLLKNSCNNKKGKTFFVTM